LLAAPIDRGSITQFRRLIDLEMAACITVPTFSAMEARLGRQ